MADELDKTKKKTANMLLQWAEFGHQMKINKNAYVRFARGILYGKFSLFGPINKVISSLEAVGGAVEGVKRVSAGLKPIFEGLGAAIGPVKDFMNIDDSKVGAGLQSTANLFDKITGHYDETFANVFKGGFKGNALGGKKDPLLTNLMRMAMIIFGPLRILLFGAKWIILGMKMLYTKFLGTAMMMFGIALLTILAVGLFVKTFWEGIQGFWDIFGPPFMEFGAQLFTVISSVVGAFMGILGFIFGDTSFLEMAFGLLDVLGELLLLGVMVLTNLIIPAVIGIALGIISMLAFLWKSTVAFFEEHTWKAVLGLLAGIALLFFGGAFALAIGAALVIGTMWIIDKLQSLGDDWVDNLIDAINPFSGASDWWDNLEIMHEGGMSGGGPTMVGEKGMELVNLPKGARVNSNKQTQRILENSGGHSTNTYITINARDTSDGELRRIADKIGNMVNNKINRSTSSRTMG